MDHRFGVLEFRIDGLFLSNRANSCPNFSNLFFTPLTVVLAEFIRFLLMYDLSVSYISFLVFKLFSIIFDCFFCFQILTLHIFMADMDSTKTIKITWMEYIAMNRFKWEKNCYQHGSIIILQKNKSNLNGRSKFCWNWIYYLKKKNSRISLKNVCFHLNIGFSLPFGIWRSEQPHTCAEPCA